MHPSTMPPIVQCPMDLGDRPAPGPEGIALEGALAAGWLLVPSAAPGFLQITAPEVTYRTVNMGTRLEPRLREEEVHEHTGTLSCFDPDLERFCPVCASRLQGNGTTPCTLAHLPRGDARVRLTVMRPRLRCPSCGYGWTEPVPFKASGHMVTAALARYAEGLLAYGLTLKEVAHVTGLDRGTVKSIDKARLLSLYTEDGRGQELTKPETQARFLGIDEFKLHGGHRYATVIIDLETGAVLWLAVSRKKEVVFRFIDHVGQGWMAGVVAVACDMNSDFEEAFLERCPHLKVVYDRFHIVKNLNDKVIGEVRKDIQRSLEDAGDKEGARSLKRSKYLLCSSKATRMKHDAEAADAKAAPRGGTLFPGSKAVPKGGRQERYAKLIGDNELLLAADLVKEMVEVAYVCDDPVEMRGWVDEAVSTCRATGDKHFSWFADLLDNHVEGIVTHASLRISSGRVEGTNNMIKTLRRQGYGYPDDEYFFLKIMDASRRKQRW